LVAEYLDCVYRFLSPEDANTKMHALLEASLESLPDIVHTKDGSAVVRLLLAKGNAKVSVTETVCDHTNGQDRKQILQHLRKHVEAMSKDGDAQMVLFTAFDCVE
jgi:pumilio family protein 6